MTEVNNGQLRALIERIETVEETKRAAADDVKEIYAEAKGQGFDVKIMRKLIAARRKTEQAIESEGEIFALYAKAIGMQTTFCF